MKSVIKGLKPYLNYSFSSGGYTGDDYLSFQRKFKNHIKKILPECYVLHDFNPNHYYCSGVIKDNKDRFIYFSISDVRYFPNEWYNRILIRTMSHDKDWCGGSNYYTNLEKFSDNIQKLYSCPYDIR